MYNDYYNTLDFAVDKKGRYEYGMVEEGMEKRICKKEKPKEKLKDDRGRETLHST